MSDQELPEKPKGILGGIPEGYSLAGYIALLKALVVGLGGLDPDEGKPFNPDQQWHKAVDELDMEDF